MYLMWTLEGHKHPFVHPTLGLGIKYIFEPIWYNDYSVSLTCIVQNMPLWGYIFSGI